MSRFREWLTVFIALAALIVGLLAWLAPFSPIGHSPIAREVAGTQATENLPQVTVTLLPPTEILPTHVPPTATPYVKGYDTIQAYGTRHVSLVKGELIVGTADRFQDDVDKAGQPPCTAFIIRGPIEIDLRIWYGGWDYWASVYDDGMAEVLLQRKVSELQQHLTCPSRGINTVRLP